MKKKYEQVISHIEKLVETKPYKAGERLPSIRVMADKLKCNKATVIRAYEELVMRHRVYCIPKSGYYLIQKAEEGQEKSPPIDFSAAIPDPKLLPFSEFNHCISKAVEAYREHLFSCTETQGIRSLRKTLAKQFQENQIFSTEEHVYITSGSQQALSILSTMTFPNGKEKVLLEQPTYALMQDMLILYKTPMTTIKRDLWGIDLKELERIFKEESIKFFYTMPRFQNPLGTSYSEKEKLRIAELAGRYDVYIVEDDYFVDIEVNRKSFPIHYYDVAGKVVYVKSFAKTFMPGIRIGAVILPEPLREEFMNRKRCQDQSTSVLAQGALELFISSGMYSNHMEKIQKQYQKKMNDLRECMKSFDAFGLEYNIPQTGFFVWIKLPENINGIKLERRLAEKNVQIRVASEFYMPESQFMEDNSIRIAISSLPTESIRRGIQSLLQIIEEWT